MELESDQRLDQCVRSQVHDHMVGHGQAVQLILCHGRAINLVGALQQAADDEIAFAMNLPSRRPEPLLRKSR